MLPLLQRPQRRRKRLPNSQRHRPRWQTKPMPRPQKLR
jgi:hypothetical protein